MAVRWSEDRRRHDLVYRKREAKLGWRELVAEARKTATVFA